MKRIWVTWESQRRNRELADALGAKLFEWAELDRIRNPARKYALGAARTLATVRRERPDVVFCQNPSLVLASLLCRLKGLGGFPVCVDAHNAGLFPAEGRSPALLRLARHVQRGADLTLVTNGALKREVEGNGGRAFVLPDRIPTIPDAPPKDLRGRVNLLFICSYGADEPYEAVFDAARGLPPGVFVYVTGNYRKRGIDPAALPGNVVLTGFVPEEEYATLLRSADATIDLTTRDHCLVCGAYETVAVEKPMILSDTRALREYFSRGAVYAPNTAEGIRVAVEETIGRIEELGRGVRELKEIRSAEWEVRRRELETMVSSWEH